MRVFIFVLVCSFLFVSSGFSEEDFSPRWSLYDNRCEQLCGSVTMDKAVDNLKQHEKEILTVLKVNRIPFWLVALAIEESRIKVESCSHKGACGVWQLMPHTARSYGLEVSSARDEREDVALSTHAAAGYLKKHYERFGSWKLAIVAYNCSSAPVFKAIREHGTTDVVALCNKRALPVESCNLLAKTLAAKYCLETHYGYGSDSGF